MHILGIDRGTKNIGLSWRSSTTKITLPLGCYPNGPTCEPYIASLLEKYAIDMIVYGKTTNTTINSQIANYKKKFKKQFPALVRQGVNEAYSTLEANEILGSFNHPGQDCVASMVILKEYLKTV